jgi:hypothetical protein
VTVPRALPTMPSHPDVQDTRIVILPDCASLSRDVRAPASGFRTLFRSQNMTRSVVDGSAARLSHDGQTGLDTSPSKRAVDIKAVERCTSLIARPRLGQLSWIGLSVNR